MRKSLHLLFLLFILAACTDDNVVNVNNSEEFKKIQKIMDSTWSAYMTKNNLPAASGIVLYINCKGSTCFLKSNMGSDVNENYHFRIASNTKVFTASAIMLLYQRGKLNIDDKITALIPGKNEPYVPNDSNYNVPFKDKITIRQLLQHRAGVFDATNSDIPDTVKQPYAGQNYVDYMSKTEGADYQFSFDKLIGIISKNQLYYFEPGTDYHYSNGGYSILAKIVERVSGISYSSFIQTEFFDKNNMTSSYSPTLGTDQKIPSPFIHSYLYFNNQMNDVTDNNMSAFVGGGNLISTPLEMAKWIKSLMTGNAGISMNNIELMKDYSNNLANKYGLGVMFRDTIGYGHSGVLLSFISYVTYNPEKDCSICFVCNLFDFSSMPNSNDSFKEQFNLIENLCKRAVGILK